MNPLDPSNLIGRGAQADVYLHEGQAIKLFHPGTPEDAVLYEADIQQRVHLLGLPAPRVFGMAVLQDRFAILMEHVPGPSLGALMEKDRPHAMDYMAQAVNLQAQLHRTQGTGLPSQRDKLFHRISSADALSQDVKRQLLDRLDSIASDCVVCHGDFHPYNILQTENGPVIIDWVDASCGSAGADACRTYLLFLLHGKEAAEPYLSLYCGLTGTEKEAVMQWLPILAAARLLEYGRGDDTDLLVRLAHDPRP